MRPATFVTLLIVSSLVLANCSEAPTPEMTGKPTVQKRRSEPGPQAAARELVDRAETCLDSYYWSWEAPIEVPKDCGDGMGPEALLERAIELYPEAAGAYTALAKLHAYVAVDNAAGLEVCKRLQSALPNHVDSYLCIYTYSEFSEFDLDKAIELHRKIIELRPDHYFARWKLGVLLLKTDPDEAYEHYRVALSRFPFRESDLSEGAGSSWDHIHFIRSLSRVRPKEGADLLQLLIDGIGGAYRGGWCGPLRSLLTEEFSEDPDIRPAIAKFREHCETPDLERAIALAKEARTEREIDEAIAAWEPLFDNPIFALDAYFNLFRLYRKGQSSQSWRWLDWKGYGKKIRALVVNYFERESRPLNRCQAARGTDFRDLLPELYSELQQECGSNQNNTKN